MAQTYTVQKGDTLSAIGQKYGVDWKSITGYSSGNPNLIRPGETLTIPDAPTQKPAGDIKGTLPKEPEKTLPGSPAPTPDQKTLPQGSKPADDKPDSFGALTIALRAASNIALKSGMKSGMQATFGGMQNAVPGFAPEKVSGGTVSDIINFVEKQVAPTVQSEFNNMKDIVDGIQRQKENLRIQDQKLKEDAQKQITQAISNGMWNKMDYSNKKNLWEAAGYLGEPQNAEGDFSSQVVIDEDGMGTNLIIDKGTGQVVRKESLGKIGKGREPGTSQAEKDAKAAKDKEEKDIADFRSKAADLILKLDSGDVEWGTAWDTLHMQFPKASNQLIDQTLGGGNDPAKGGWWGRANTQQK